MKLRYSLLPVLLFSARLFAQEPAIVHYGYPLERPLNGKVRSWEKKDGEKLVCYSRFDESGRVTVDSGMCNRIVKRVWEYDTAGTVARAALYLRGQVYHESNPDFWWLQREGFIRPVPYGEGVFEYTYDANGRVLKKKVTQSRHGDYEVVYTYDAAGRLISVKGDRVDIYQVNYEGQRYDNLQQTVVDAETIYTYDAKGQLSEKSVSGINELGHGFQPVRELHFRQTFHYDSSGRIVRDEVYSSATDIRATNNEPSQTFPLTTKVSYVNRYTYDARGNMIEFEHYDSDVFDNIRFVMTYDDQGHLTEKKRYDEYNISRDHFFKPEDKLLKEASADKFDINTNYPGYWSSQQPAVVNWQYDAAGRRTVYLVGGDRLSYKVTWEYDANGKPVKELHHDVYHGTIRQTFVFDAQGNVVEETVSDYFTKKSQTYRYNIVYY